MAALKAMGRKMKNARNGWKRRLLSAVFSVKREIRRFLVVFSEKDGGMCTGNVSSATKNCMIYTNWRHIIPDLRRLFLKRIDF